MARARTPRRPLCLGAEQRVGHAAGLHFWGWAAGCPRLSRYPPWPGPRQQAACACTGAASALAQRCPYAAPAHLGLLCMLRRLFLPHKFAACETRLGLSGCKALLAGGWEGVPDPIVLAANFNPTIKRGGYTLWTLTPMVVQLRVALAASSGELLCGLGLRAHAAGGRGGSKG